MSSVANIFPSLSYEDAPAAIDWLCRVFGFTKRLVVPGAQGSIRHAELSMDGGVIMLSSVRPEEGRLSPRSLHAVTQTLSVLVQDPDAHHARALAAGAEILQEPSDEAHGARGYLCRDLEGHLWYFCNYRPGDFWDPPAHA